MKNLIFFVFTFFSIESFAAEGCRVAISIDLNAKIVYYRLTTAVSSDLVDLVEMDKSCSEVLINSIEEFPTSVMFINLEFANVYIHTLEAQDPLSMIISLTANKYDFEIIKMKNSYDIKVVDRKFANRVQP